MAPHGNAKPDLAQEVQYQIRVKGVLDQYWAKDFGDLTVTNDGSDTFLTGPVPDQAALHGLLAIIRDLGLPLLKLAAIDSEDGDGAA